jgi:hypothetical protein
VIVVVVIEGVAIALLALLVLGLLRSHAEILRALHALGVSLDPDGHDPSASGVTTPVAGPVRPADEAVRAGDATLDLAGIDPRGRAVHVAVVGVDRLTLVAFLSSGCLSCRGFWETFADPAAEVPGGARVVVVTKGPEAESESLVRQLAPAAVTTVLSSDAWTAYGVPVAPYFVLVDGASGRVVGEGAATKWDQVRNLMGQALADAGIATERGRAVTSGPAATRAHLSGAAREARIDEELRAAGIQPGHPSLYPSPSSEHER